MTFFCFCFSFFYECVFIKLFHNGLKLEISGIFYGAKSKEHNKLNMLFDDNMFMSTQINLIECQAAKSFGNHRSTTTKQVLALVNFTVEAFSFFAWKKLSNKPLIRLKRYLSRYLSMSYTHTNTHKSVEKCDFFLWENFRHVRC